MNWNGVIIRNLERDGAIRKTRHPVHGREDGLILPFDGTLLHDTQGVNHAGDEEQHREAGVFGGLGRRAGRENRERGADKG